MASLEAIEKAKHILYDEGTVIRQEVLGSGHIAQSKALPEFLQPVQGMAVAAGWSMCWAREGLERKTRSLLCLVMLAVLGRDHELGVHVRGAISNGCTKEEIREALLQASLSPSRQGTVPILTFSTLFRYQFMREYLVPCMLPLSRGRS